MDEPSSWTVAELRRRLDEAAITPDADSLDGGLLDNRYAIERRGRTWYVYFAERGEITWERLCVNEGEACQLLLAELTRNRTRRP